MIKTYTEELFQRFTGQKQNAVIGSRAEQNEILCTCKNVRAKDYIFDFDLTAAKPRQLKAVTTAANWYFVLLNVAVSFGDGVEALDVNGANWPRIAITFPDYEPNTPLKTSEPQFMNAVQSALVFARESANENGVKLHYEEAKNFYYSLEQRFTIDVEAVRTGSADVRGSVILTGLEINLEGVNDG